MAKLIKSTNYLMMGVNSTLLFKSENFEIVVDCYLNHLEVGHYGFLSIGDYHTDTMSFKFRGDLCNINQLTARLETEGMTDLVNELRDLRKEVEDTSEAISLKANKKLIKKTLGVSSVKLFGDLTKEQKNVEKFKYYSTEKGFNTLPKGMNKMQFHKRYPSTMGYEHNESVTITIDLIKSCLETAQQILKEELKK